MHLCASGFAAGHSGLTGLFPPCPSPYPASQPARMAAPQARMTGPQAATSAARGNGRNLQSMELPSEASHSSLNR